MGMKSTGRLGLGRQEAGRVGKKGGEGQLTLRTFEKAIWNLLFYNFLIKVYLEFKWYIFLCKYMIKEFIDLGW